MALAARSHDKAQISVSPKRYHSRCQKPVLQASEVGVGAAVVLQVPRLPELARAHIALEGPDPCVDLDMPVAITVACKCLAAHATAERPVLEVLRLVQAVFKPVVAGEATVAASVAASPPGPLTATVCSQLVFRHQVRATQRAADPFPLHRLCSACWHRLC